MILSRLKNAIREQNWFAVVLEMLIVIVGVVIGFQISAWGEARNETSQEQTYLQQIAEDLRETERIILDGDMISHPQDRATGQLLRAFYERERPSRDSLLTWLSKARGIWPIRPVLGTAEALVATGDLSLIRNDSLRSAITAYLDDTRRLMVIHDDNTAMWFDYASSLSSLVDRASFYEGFDTAVRDSLVLNDPFWPLPDGERRDPFPFDPETFLKNRNALTAIDAMADMISNMKTIRRMIRERTVELREQVEAELNR